MPLEAEDERDRPGTPLRHQQVAGHLGAGLTGEHEPALDEAFAALPYDELERRLDAEDVVWSPVQTPAEVVADAQAVAAECFVEVEDGQGGRFRSPNNPARFGGEEPTQRTPPPLLGQHTDAVLAELGYAPAELAALRAAGAIA